MLNEVLKGVLTILVGAALQFVFKAIGVEIDPVLFNTIVGAIVLWILIHLGLETAMYLAPRYFK